MNETFRRSALVALVSVLMTVGVGCGGADEAGAELPDSEETASSESALMGCPGTAMIIYENADFDGRHMTLCKGHYPDLRQLNGGLSFWENWNDRISSVYITSKNNDFHVCQDINFKDCGNIHTIREIRDFRSLAHRVGGNQWNDAISSLWF